MKFASLCVLSFRRPDFLKRSIESLHRNTKYPFELIINDDGSKDDAVYDYLEDLLSKEKVSYIIKNAGQNMGVGKAFRNGIGVSSGDLLFKLDDDLEYLPGWLTTVSNILENNGDVIACGLFNYRNYAPDDDRFQILEERDDCLIVNDFVNSGYGVRASAFEEYGHVLGDDGWHTYMRGQEYGVSNGSKLKWKIAIPKRDVVFNFGFGKNSVYVKDGQVRRKSEVPLIFNNESM